jgi:hypothetical protein
MLYRNAPLILLVVCGLILFIFYTADDQSPGTSPGPGSNSLLHKGHKGRHASAIDIPNGKNNKTKLKTILYWNEFYGRYDTYDFGFGHEAFVEKNCAYSNCFATKDRGLLPSIGM